MIEVDPRRDDSDGIDADILTERSGGRRRVRDTKAGSREVFAEGRAETDAVPVVAVSVVDDRDRREARGQDVVDPEVRSETVVTIYPIEGSLSARGGRHREQVTDRRVNYPVESATEPGGRPIVGNLYDFDRKVTDTVEYRTPAGIEGNVVTFREGSHHVANVDGFASTDGDPSP